MKKPEIKEFFLQAKIKDVMAAPVITVKETDDFSLVQEKIELYDVRHLPVVDESGVIVGLITQRDLYKIHSPRRLEEGDWYYDKDALNQFLLKKVMLLKPFTLRPEDSLFEAIEVTVKNKFGCIPIVDEIGRPCGILTRDTILKYLIS